MDDANGDITDFPSEVFSFFNKKGAGDAVTPAVLQGMIGSSTIPLPNYDIYVMGKKPGGTLPAYFTKLRITTKASERNTVQGLLGVRFLAGYGYRKWVEQGGSSDVTIKRPADIKKLVTEDTSSFKKRAVIYLNGNVLSLSLADGFCRIPLMDHRLLGDFENPTNSKKRDAYALKKKKGKEWAHINRNSMLAENKKAMHRMLLPYKKNLLENEYFREFLKDIVEGCLQLRKEFCPEEDTEISTQQVLACFSVTKRRSEEAEIQHQPGKRRVLDKVSNNLDMSVLRKIPPTELSW